MSVLPSPSATGAQARPPEHDTRGRLLVVEDEDALRKVMDKYFVSSGYEVTVAASAEEALFGGLLGDMYARRPNIDCMLLDVHLPGISGVQLARMVQSSWPDTPTIFITGDPDEIVDDGTPEFGSVCVRKPFQLHELETVIATTIPKK